MLRQLVPDADVIGLLANQNSPQGQEQMQDVADAAKSLGQQLTILNGSNDQEIDAAFATLAERRVKALLIAADPSYDPRRNRLIALSAQYAIPTMYHFRDFPLAGGLASYGASISDLIARSASMLAGSSTGTNPRISRSCCRPSSSS